MSYSVPQKKTPLKEKPYKNKNYLSWLHTQGFTCMICDNPQIEIHHLLSGSRGRPDNFCVLLCPEDHRGRFSPHGADAKEFRAQYQDDMELEADRLFQTFKDEECE